MKAVVFRDVEQVEVAEVSDAQVVEPDDAVVRVTTAAICGSDLHFFHGKVPLAPGETIGHEGVGVVEAVGPGVTRFRPGDRVVMAFNIVCGECWFCLHGQPNLCDDFRNLGAGVLGGDLGGTQAELVRVPRGDVNLLAIPDGMSDEQAVFVGDILTTGYYGAAIAGIGPDDIVVVLGAGPVGFFAIQAAVAEGAARILALDTEPDRLLLAEKVGAVPVNVRERNAQMAVAERTEGRGADVVIEAVGSAEAFEGAVEVVRRGGTVVVLGMYTIEQVEIPLGVYWARTLDVRFSGITPIHAWWERSMAAVADGTIDPLPIVSHTLPLADAAEGYRMFAAHEATKVLLKP